MIGKFKKRFSSLTSKQHKAIVFVLIFAVVGGISLIIIHAANPNVSFEPENGTVVGPATIGSDNNASGGKYIQFGGLPIYSVPSTIAADCSSDVAPAFLTWFNTVPDNSVINFPKGACYDFESTLYINGRNNLIINGNNAQFKVTQAQTTDPCPYPNPVSWPDSRRTILIRNSNNITLTNFTINGSNTTGAWVYSLGNQDGIAVTNSSSNITLEHLNINHVYGDGIETAGQNDNPTHVIADYNIINNTGRNSMSVYSGSNVDFSYNHIGDSGIGLHFDIEPFPIGPNPRAVHDVTISHNYIDGKGGFLSNRGSGFAQIDNITVTNNFVHNGSIGVLVGGASGGTSVLRHNFKITDNISDAPIGENVRPMMTFNDIDGLTLSGNEILAPVSQVKYIGVLLANSTNVSITGNWLPNVDTIFSTNALPQPITVTADAAIGQNMISLSGNPPTEVVYQVGSGSTAELIAINKPLGGGVYELLWSLTNHHAAGEPFVTAPSTNYTQSNNTNSPTDPPPISGWNPPLYAYPPSVVPGPFNP